MFKRPKGRDPRFMALTHAHLRMESLHESTNNQVDRIIFNAELAKPNAKHSGGPDKITVFTVPDENKFG